MTWVPPSDWMPEGEVSLLLAFHLLTNKLVHGAVEVAIDGAQVQTGDVVHFAIEAFLQEHGCEHQGDREGWQGTYRLPRNEGTLHIHAKSGRGDVAASLAGGGALRVESKKGPLAQSPSSSEDPLLREALGQLLTMSEVGEEDILAVAVPDSVKFRALAEEWRQAPLIRQVGFRIVTVGRDGEVVGLEIE